MRDLYELVSINGIQSLQREKEGGKEREREKGRERTRESEREQERKRARDRESETIRKTFMTERKRETQRER